MTAFDPRPDPDTVAERREQRWAETDTFGRVYDVIMGTADPMPAAEVSAVADCSPNAARKHLDRLAEMGLVRADREPQPARYTRDEAYLQWFEARTIARDLSVDEIATRVEQLHARREEFVDRFGTTDPAAVSLVDTDDHEAVHDRLEAISDWQAIERDVRLYDLARRLALSDGQRRTA